MSDLQAVVLFRSNAEALMALAILTRARVQAEVVPSPQGCGYSLRMPVRVLEQAMRLLLSQHVPVTRIELC